MNLPNQLDSIRTREDFLAFVQGLSNDLRDNSKGWENADLGLFLSALGAWVGDMDGYYKNRGERIPQQLDWKILAQMLWAARIYE